MKTTLEVLQEKYDLIVQFGANGAESLIDAKTKKRPSPDRISRFLDEAEEKKALGKEDIEQLRLWGDRLEPFPLRKD